MLVFLTSIRPISPNRSVFFSFNLCGIHCICLKCHYVVSLYATIRSCSSNITRSVAFQSFTTQETRHAAWAKMLCCYASASGSSRVPSGWTCKRKIGLFSNVATCQCFTNSIRIKHIWKTNYYSIDWWYTLRWTNKKSFAKTPSKQDHLCHGRMISWA